MKSRGDLRDVGPANQEVTAHCHWVVERHTLQPKLFPKSIARTLEPPVTISATTL